MPLNPELKAKTISDYATTEGDTGSTEVQIAIMQQRILQIGIACITHCGHYAPMPCAAIDPHESRAL
jgi:hypothetical protein